MITLNTNFILSRFCVGRYDIVASELISCEFNSSYSRNYPHTHDSFEVCFVQSGTGLFVDDQNTYPIEKDCLFLGRPYIKHEIIQTSDEPLFLYYCNFTVTPTDRKPCLKKSELVIDRFLKAPLSIVNNCRHLNAFIPMFTSYPENGGFFSSKKILELLLTETMLALTPQDLSISREEITFKAKVSGYITTHLTEKITVNAVAGYMNISQRTLFYLFKKHFNTTPIQYINHAKISSAILYLREGFSVTHVSDMFAFSEPSAFNRTFKKYTGVSPREYLSQNPK